MDDQAWVVYLEDWKRSIRVLYEKNQNAWNYMGLPDISGLELQSSDTSGLNELMRLHPAVLKDDFVAFYRVTNGWPLWLGEFHSGIAPVSEIDLFEVKCRESFEIAMEFAPADRVPEEPYVSLSREDLSRALLVSTPPAAREIVLSLHTGEICLYQFDCMFIFLSFSEFMRAQYKRMLEYVKGTIGIYDQGWRKG